MCSARVAASLPTPLVIERGGVVRLKVRVRVFQRDLCPTGFDPLLSISDPTPVVEPREHCKCKVFSFVETLEAFAPKNETRYGGSWWKSYPRRYLSPVYISTLNQRITWSTCVLGCVTLQPPSFNRA